LSKLQKLLTLLLVLPLCVVLFSGVVRAEIAEVDCTDLSDEDCLALVETKRTEIDDLQNAFSDCWGKCSDYWNDYDPSYYWDWCTADYVDVTDDWGVAIATGCDVIVNKVTTETEEADPLAMSEALNDFRVLLGGQKTKLQRAIQSEKAVDAKQILSITGQTPFEDAKEFLDKVIDLLVKMVGLVALVFLVVGGFRLIVAAGNDNEIQKAKTMITYSIIGLAVTLLAYLIVAFAQGILYR